MGKLRITVEFINPRWWITEKSGGGRNKYLCAACGSPLKDLASIKRGYGKRCFEKLPKMIILRIDPEEPNQSGE